MTKNTELEVADEIISMKIANEVRKGKDSNNFKIKKLMNEREKMYKGNKEVIKKIINIYGSELKMEES